MITLPARAVETAGRQPLLRGLLAAGAGYWPRAVGPLRGQGTDRVTIIYCARGSGWCEVAGKRHAVRAEDLVVLPAGTAHACGGNGSTGWTIHLAEAVGSLVPAYLGELGVGPENPVVWVGEDLQLVFLFNELLKCLGRGFGFLQLLEASHTLGYLLALMIRQRRERRRDAGEGLQKVARCIIYMSEHLDQRLKVSALAGLASLSPAHFTALFKEQTGSAPRDYLHLVRMHRACQWLTGTELSLKDIAARLGYQDQFHFSRKFKGFSGMSPSEFRATQRTHG